MFVSMAYFTQVMCLTLAAVSTSSIMRTGIVLYVREQKPQINPGTLHRCRLIAVIAAVTAPQLAHKVP